MLTSNHALAGALLAVGVQEPALSIPLAFVSHFLMDMLPHFGIAVHGDDVRTRNNKPLFKIVTRADVALTVISVVLLPILLRDKASTLVIFGCILAAISPDFIWVIRFFKELKTGKLGPKSRFSKFHKWIQWGEYPGAIVVDVIWLLASVGIIIGVLR